MINDKFDQDEYGEVFNSDKTYQGIADQLEKMGSVVFGWTDQLGSHLDIMLVLQPRQVGSLQRGLRATTDLFVAVMSFGAFGFDVSESNTHFGYIAEKLNMHPDATTEKLTELINGVRALLFDEADIQVPA